MESEGNFGRFVIEPLEKGFGTTLGNALRRVLLGYLPGAAVTNVRIENIQHEFSTIPHVKEDTIEFLLNVKELRLKSITGRAGKLTLEAKGGKQVFAADITPSADFEIANPELYLAALDSPKAKLEVDFDVEISHGYQEAKSGDNLAIGVIPVDAIFSPIRKVNFTVEPIHVGKETSRERLHLEVWTDGTISPADAVSTGAEILVGQLSPFVNFTRMLPPEPQQEAEGSVLPEEQYNTSVEQLNLSVRTLNCLRRGGITTLGELVTRSEKELMALRNFGQKSKQEIDQRLQELGLSPASREEESKLAIDPGEAEVEEA